jgi:hypothetical protein
MAAIAQLCVAPNNSNDLVIDNNTIYTSVLTNGVPTFTSVNVVPNTWLTTGAQVNNMVSGTLYSLVSLAGYGKGTYQINLQGQYTYNSGTPWATTDVLDFYWDGSLGDFSTADSIVIPYYNYAATRQLGSFNVTDTFVATKDNDTFTLHGRFTGAATQVSVTILPYITVWKIA